MDALISIIVPVYNRELYLRQTMDCICEQTYTELEIIMVDDGSSDKSLEILHFDQELMRVTVAPHLHEH